MTVNELKCKIESYLKNHDGNDIVLICDDWCPQRFFGIDLAIGTVLSREVKHADVDENDVQLSPPEYKDENVMILTTDLTKEEI